MLTEGVIVMVREVAMMPKATITMVVLVEMLMISEKEMVMVEMVMMVAMMIFATQRNVISPRLAACGWL